MIQLKRLLAEGGIQDRQVFTIITLISKLQSSNYLVGFLVVVVGAVSCTIKILIGKMS